MLRLKPTTLKEANALVGKIHRHHGAAVGHKFSIGAEKNGQLVAAVIVGRPVARMSNDGYTAEVTRLVSDGSHNACSFLYSAAARAAKAMGYQRIQTYILKTEPGTSLRAAGWELDGETSGGSWSRPSRPRDDDHPLIPKQRWAKEL